jgi:hypothetical protein
MARPTSQHVNLCRILLSSLGVCVAHATYLDAVLQPWGSAAAREEWAFLVRNHSLPVQIKHLARRMPRQLWGPRTNCTDLSILGARRKRNAVGQSIRLGAMGFDGEKKVCGLSLLKAPCNVISIGSKNQWDFEAAVAKHTACHIHTFDCTVPRTTLPPDAIRSRVTFYHACLVPFDIPPQPKHAPKFVGYPDGAQLKHLSGMQQELGELWNWNTLLKKAGISSGPEYVKIDIEGMEYTALYSIIEEMRLQNTMHMLPKQLAVEFHNVDQGKKKLLPWKQTMKWFYHFYQVGRYLLIDYAPNLKCPNCDEALFALANPLSDWVG